MPLDCLAPVIENTHLSDHYNVVTFHAPAIASAVRPGQFVMIKTSAGYDPLLRRPFSIFQVKRGPDGVADRFTILNKRIGPGTRRLFDCAPGAAVPCLGPLGVPFAATPGREAWMVAGGVGLAPFALLAERLRERGVTRRLYYGGRSAADLFFLEDFERQGATLVLTTEDGTRGERGRVTEPLARDLDARGERAGSIEIFACGPEPMLRAVARIARERAVRCQVSVERVMGCGLGGCYSCVIAVQRGASGRPHYVRSCIEGPVFDAAEIAWECP